MIRKTSNDQKSVGQQSYDRSEGSEAHRSIQKRRRSPHSGEDPAENGRQRLTSNLEDTLAEDQSEIDID